VIFRRRGQGQSPKRHFVIQNIIKYGFEGILRIQLPKFLFSTIPKVKSAIEIADNKSVFKECQKNLINAYGDAAGNYILGRLTADEIEEFAYTNNVPKRLAKKKGLKVTAEVTPHHLFLTDQRIKNYDTNAKMAPPLRSEEDRRAVLKALSEGIIDAIATDHAPHAIIEKEVEFDQAAFGIVGFETALGLAMSFVHAGELKIERMIAALTTGPAKIFSLPAGSLEVGALADITLFDPKKSWIVKPELFRSKSKNTPFGGIKLKGKVAYTLVGGEIVYQDI